MTNQILMLENASQGRFFYDTNLEKIVGYELPSHAKFIDLSIGQRDKVLKGLDLGNRKDVDLEKIIEFEHRGRTFFLRRIEDTPHEVISPYQDTFQYRFQLTGSNLNIIIPIDCIFTSDEEIDTTQVVENVFYLANGVLGFITDELEIHTLFGERFESKYIFDTGYRATENTRSYFSRKPDDLIRSFGLGETEKQEYVLVLVPSRYGHYYDIHNLGTNIAVGGSIARTKNFMWGSLITLDVRVFTLGNDLYIAGIERDKVQLYRILNQGTAQEALVKDRILEHGDVKDIKLIL